MIQVVYPEPHFKIKQEQGKHYLFDSIRKIWVVLTEEEWVRQNFIGYLVQELKYPAALIAVEKEIHLGELKKRFDVLVYNANHLPWMLIECKAPEVSLSESVINQALRYNISVPVPFIVITNGNNTYGWEKWEGGLKDLTQLPAWT